MGFKIKFKQLLQSGAGSSADGGGGGGGAASPPSPPTTPPPSPRPEPPPSPRKAPPSPRPSPRRALSWDENEDLDNAARSHGGFRHCLFMSVQQNTPHDIDRQNCESFTKREYISLHKKWLNLLAGKRTYLRPPNEDRVPSYNYDDFLFQSPKPLMRPLGCQEPLSVLVHEAAKNPIIQEKFKILSEHYALFRRTRRDGSCFYRAFLFSYLENLGQMQDSRAEVTRLMECVARSRKNFCRLKWSKAYFLNPEAYFSSVISEFKHLVNSIANGLNADELYGISLQEMLSSRILSLLRLLTEIEIRTHEEDYKSFVRRQEHVLMCCIKAVRPMDVDANKLQMRALSYALGIPLRVEVVEAFSKDRVVQVKRVDFFPRPESGVSTTSGLLHLIESYYPLSTAPSPPEQRRASNSVMQAGVSTNDNLLSSDGMPLVTLLCRRCQFDILYRK